jgi:hypothetical protein
VDGACLSGLGSDASSVSTLDGVVWGYGYDPEWYGHARVLFLDRHDGAGWQPAAFASWDEGSGSFSFDWDVGFVNY